MELSWETTPPEQLLEARFRITTGFHSGQHIIKNCYMDYLASYLGDEPGYHCGVCGHYAEQAFPFIQISERIVSEVILFLEEKYLPHIDKGGEHNLGHEAGWSLSYHADTRIGALVSASKYRNADDL